MAAATVKPPELSSAVWDALGRPGFGALVIRGPRASGRTFVLDYLVNLLRPNYEEVIDTGRTPSALMHRVLHEAEYDGSLFVVDEHAFRARKLILSDLDGARGDMIVVAGLTDEVPPGWWDLRLADRALDVRRETVATAADYVNEGVLTRIGV
jgi:hypothetical protein